jgi:carbamoyl-phosphate synthase large subunit
VQGVTIRDDDLSSWIEKLLEVCAKSGAKGPLTIQAFLTSNGPVLTEINARFGGGFPLANAAGADYPRWLLQEVLGQHIEPRMGDYREGLYMTRYAVEVFLERPFQP